MKYMKINTLWKRDEKDKYNIIEGDYSKEEFENIKYWHVTEKIDGTNIRVIYDGEGLQFKGRTSKSVVPAHLLKELQEIFKVEKVKEVFEGKKVILFGEGYGHKIQKCGNKYLQDDVSFCLFDVYVEHIWLKQDSIQDVADRFSVKRAFQFGILQKGDIINMVKDPTMSILAEKELEIEGVVARSHPLMLFRDGTPIMFKLKVKDYRRLNGEKRR